MEREKGRGRKDENMGERLNVMVIYDSYTITITYFYLFLSIKGMFFF